MEEKESLCSLVEIFIDRFDHKAAAIAITGSTARIGKGFIPDLHGTHSASQNNGKPGQSHHTGYAPLPAPWQTAESAPKKTADGKAPSATVTMELPWSGQLPANLSGFGSRR